MIMNTTSHAPHRQRRPLPWDRADIRQARQTPLRPVLERLGFQLRPMPGDNYVIAGLTPEITIKAHYWVCAHTGVSGNAIDFLVKVKGMTFTEAVRLLLASDSPQDEPQAS